MPTLPLKMEQDRQAREAHELHAQLLLQRAMQQLEEQERALRAQRDQMEQQLERARREVERLKRRATQEASIPEGAVLRAYALRQIRANAVAEVLQNIYGAQAPRVAIDEPRNLLLVIADDKMAKSVEQVVKELDRPPAEAEKSELPAETLQLRFIWVVDDQESELKPAEERLDSHVIQSLADLGIEAPKIVCQPVVSIIVEEERPGECEMEVPVLINGVQMRFRAIGSVRRSGEDRYVVPMGIGIRQTVIRTSGQEREVEYVNEDNSIEGTILTGLDQYTVLGTSVVVPGGQRAKRQLPCAFVIHLARARTFPAETLLKVEFLDRR